MQLFIKNMVSLRSELLVRHKLSRMGLQILSVELGIAEIEEDVSPEQLENLKQDLLASDLELIDDKKSILIEKIKNVVQELIPVTAEMPAVNYSVYIVEKLGYDYSYLSNLFSKYTGNTIQQFVIRHKIERVKELLTSDDMNITEIASALQYSSVGHLSNQFKKVTGMTPSDFKKTNHIDSLDESPRTR